METISAKERTKKTFSPIFLQVKVAQTMNYVRVYSPTKFIFKPAASRLSKNILKTRILLGIFAKSFFSSESKFHEKTAKLE